MWEETPEMKTTSRGHQRQVFLFKECIVLCKLKRDANINTDSFTFKNKMKVRCDLTRRAEKYKTNLSLITMAHMQWQLNLTCLSLCSPS